VIKRSIITALVSVSGLISFCFFSAVFAADRDEARLELKTSPDNNLSPFTGYTREHWIEIAGKLVAGFLPYFDRETGMPDFRGHDAESGHFQYCPGFKEESTNAFGRTLILAALYSAATGRNTVPGYDGPVNGPYLKGIIRGTDPSDPAYWGPTAPYGAFGSEIAEAIMDCPQFYWDPFTPEQKKRLADWLALLVQNVGFECNCWYFNTAPVPVLERYKYPYKYDYITEQMARMLSWYSGSGFFIDGGNKAYDYYNFWGFQLFNLYHYRYTDPWRLKFGRQIRESTAAFMENFPYFFGSDGAPVPFGRSLTYRIAAVCPVGYAEAAGLGTLHPGLERRIASGCLKYFWERGMMSASGLVQPGWLGPNAIVAEQYCHRGAPYWISVGFSPLLLSADHPFWNKTEEPMPADLGDEIKVIPGAQMVLKTNKRRGEARLYPIGSPRHLQVTWQTGTKYYQHSYSSAIGWAGTGEAGPELAAGRTGVSLDGKNFSYRTQPAPIFLSGRHNSNSYAANLGEAGYAKVITQTLIGRDGEVHCVYHFYPRPLYLRVAGYGIAVKHGEKASEALDKENLTLRVKAAPYESVLRLLMGPAGKLETVAVTPRPGWNHSHLFGGTAAFPQWTSEKPIPPKTLVVFYTDAARGETVTLPEFSLWKDQMEDGYWVKFEEVANLVEIY
jgi:hypothetical protein